jgi:putative Mg2+ transporter-C (MgtC) family protein
MTELDGFHILPHLAALAAAYVLALPIGWDRERMDRSTGLRTFPLVAIAACGFVPATEPLLSPLKPSSEDKPTDHD